MMNTQNLITILQRLYLGKRSRFTIHEYVGRFQVSIYVSDFIPSYLVNLIEADLKQFVPVPIMLTITPFIQKGKSKNIRISR